jgi:hypothetical protein
VNFVEIAEESIHEKSRGITMIDTEFESIAAMGQRKAPVTELTL